ncbi:MAG TPA: cyclodeaminase/cyclohydrolase family protein [Roseiflexaceae bacterium]|nr:cyclodeaminase/cyclohydrolase family protein [Roseiflexaceae bacterium]HMP38908.1 cyclodeaminase/cyclohydrolase family protein [Roseiflexaceae bacterium]
MSEPLLEQRIDTFLEQLASSAPTPGGGSVAAITGAMAAGLLTMVCDLTIGKKQYAEFEEEAIRLRERAEALRGELQLLAQADVDAFGRLSAAYRLPRATDADAAARRAAIQAALRHATDIPFRTARAAAGLLPLCDPLARAGNRLAVSDVGAAVLLIEATVPAALLNVEINLPMLEDQLFVREMRIASDVLTGGLTEAAQRAMALVRSRMAS